MPLKGRDKKLIRYKTYCPKSAAKWHNARKDAEMITYKSSLEAVKTIKFE